MATTYTLTSNSYQGRYLQLTCTQTKNNNNTSTISWTLTAAGGTSSYYSTGPTTVTIGGTQVYYKERTSYTAEVFPAAKGSTSGTLTVTHGSDGSKSLAVSLSTAIYNTAIDTKSGTWTLDSLASASTATIGSAYIGDLTSCVISAGNSSYRHTVEFTCLNETTTVGTNLTSGTHRFYIPDSYYDVFGTRTSAAASGTCKTYSNGTLIGTTYFQFTIYAPEQSAPTVYLDAWDSNTTITALTGNSGVMIPGYSNISYSVDADVSGNASVSSISVSNGSTTKTSYSGTFTAATTPTVTATVTDSNGRTGRNSATLRTLEYVPLTCNLQSTNLSVGGVMSITISGNYFNDSFGAVNNTLTVYYRYKQGTGSYGSWTTITATKSGDSYSVTKEFTGLNPEATYTFQARAVDRLSDITSGGSAVQNRPVFDWSGEDFNFNVPVHFAKGATGLDIGGGSSGGSFDGNLNGNLQVNGSANITGDLRLKNSGNYGNTLYFGDGSYAYIAELSDDTLTIHASNIILDGNVTGGGSSGGGGATSGSWTPTLGAVSSYSVRDGWYQVVGDVCTLGFLITATARSGYESSQIQISGFPLDVQSRCCGGGTAYNVYTSAGHSFNSWWIDEYGTITGRVVPCNNTSAGNQSISTNVCYPSGGGSMTLAGTICCRIAN